MSTLNHGKKPIRVIVEHARGSLANLQGRRIDLTGIFSGSMSQPHPFALVAKGHCVIASVATTYNKLRPKRCRIAVKINDSRLPMLLGHSEAGSPTWDVLWLGEPTSIALHQETH